MSFYDEYLERKKNREQSSGYSSFWDGYLDRQIKRGAININDVISTLSSDVQKWSDSHNAYVTGHNERYNNTGYRSDSQAWLDSSANTQKELSSQAEKIRKQIETYNRYLDPKWVSEVQSYLDSAATTQKSLLDYDTKDSKYWSQWATEDDYNYAVWEYDIYEKLKNGEYDAANQMLNAEKNILSTLNPTEMAQGGMERLQKLSEYTEYVNTEKYRIKYKPFWNAIEDGNFGGAKAYVEREMDKLVNLKKNPHWFLDPDVLNSLEVLREYKEICDYYKQESEYEAYDIDAGQAELDDLEKKAKSANIPLLLKSINKVFDPFGTNSDGAPFADKIKNYKTLLSEFKEKKDFHDRAVEWQKIKSLEQTALEDPDFETFALRGMQIANPSFSSYMAGAKIQNVVTFNRDNPYQAKLKGNLGDWDFDSMATSEEYLVMTDEEAKIYSYYLEKHGILKATEYLLALHNELAVRVENKHMQEYYEYAQDKPFWSSIDSVGTSLLSAVEYVGDATNYFVDSIEDPYSAKMDKNHLAEYTNIIRSGVSDKVNWEVGGWDAFDFVYNSTMSGVDSLVASYIPGGSVVLGLSAAAQGTNDALERGMSSEQAFWNGAIQGAFEGIFESVSIGKFKSLQAAVTVGGKDICLNISKSMLVNASEEATTEVANILYDTIVNGEFSNYEAIVQQYMTENGMTREAAESKAKQDLFYQILESAGSGALMGAGFGGIGSAVSHKATKNEGAKFTSDPAALIDEALRLDPNDKYALSLKAKLESGNQVSQAELGKLSFNEMEATQNALAERDKAAKQTEKQEAEKKINAEKRLAGKIEDKNTRSELAQTVTKALTGKSVTNAELRHVAKNQAALTLLSKELGLKKDLKVGTATVSDIRNAISQRQSPAARLSSGNILSAFAAQFNMDESAERSLMVNYATDIKNAQNSKPVTPEEYAAVYGVVYGAGKKGMDISKNMNAFTKVLSKTAVAQAYRAGQNAAKDSQNDLQNSTDSDTINTNAKETENGEGIHLRDSGERNDGKDTGGQVSAVEGNARQNQGRRKGGAGPRDSEAASLSYDGEEVSAKSLGIKNGLESGKVRLVAEGSETESMREAKRIAAEHGLNAHFFGGGNLKIASGQKIISARAYIQGNDVYLRVDHPIFAADQLMRHEAGHYMIAKGEINVADVRKLINERFTPEEIDAISKAYAIAYADTGLTSDEIWEEIICDSVAEMNVFEGVEGLEASAEMAADFLPDLREATLGSRKEATGPPKTQEGKASSEFGDYTKEKYENFGWVRANNILSAGYWKNFTENFADAVANKHYFPKAKNGEFMIEAYNVYDSEGAADVIVFASGTIESPNVTKIIKIDSDNFQEIEYERREILEAERRGIQQKTGELFGFYYKTDFIGELRNKRISSTENRNSGGLDTKRRTSEIKANRIVKFHVDEVNKTITITYANGETVTESLGKTKSKASVDLFEEMDADYLSAVERGNMETAQRMVDEAAKAAGYNYHLYHGTNADFTKFDLRKYGGRNGKGEGYGIYLAANREISAPYGKNVIDSFVKFNRLAEGRKKTLSYNEVKNIVKRSCELEAQRMVEDEGYDSISDALKDTWVSNIVYTYGYSNMQQVYADVANKLLKENDNDGDIINEVMALSGAHYDYNNALDFYENILTPATGIDGFHYIWGNKDGSGVQNDIYLALKSDQVKSADPATYDDNGNVIPLSERFNSKNADIRFSQDLFEDMNEGDVETDTEAIERELSPREQLAAMLESDDMSPAQKGMLTKYKNKLSQIETNEAEIAKMNDQLDELKKNGKGNTSRADVLRKKIRDLEKMNAVSESIILNLEATKHIKRLLERERKAAYAEGVLAGQMAQGKDTAPALRKTEEELSATKRKSKNELAEYKKLAAQRESDALLAGQMAQGRKDAEILRKTEEELAGKKQSLTELRQKRKDDLDALAKRYQESIQSRTEGRRQTKLRNDIKRVVAELDHLLRHGNKKSNVKLGLQDAVAAALEAFDINAEKMERYARDMAKLDEKIAAATDPIEIEALTALREKKQRNSERLADKLQAMKKAYEDIHNGRDGENYPGYYKAEAEVIENRIAEVIEKVGNTPIGEMSLDQLDAVYDMYRMVLTTVQNANKVFRDGKLADLTSDATDMTSELQKIKKLPEERLKAGENVRGFVWNELTPYYAFKRVGSGTLMSYYDELVRGQDVYARDVDEAKQFALDTRKKHGYGKWKLDEVHSFRDKDGRKFDLTLKHMMSIYAYSKREQALDHMENGGFFFNNKETFRKKAGVLELIASNESGYKVDASVFAKIKGSLTAEQIAYVDEMQSYLTKMGEKGNEVTRVMWGIDIFKEKVYFPLKSKEDFIYQANTPAETSSLKNDGMTKETKPHASNPIVLEAFDEVWANHVEKMSKYHGFVIPIDNLNKLINYGTWMESKKIASNMSDAERYSILKDKVIKDIPKVKTFKLDTEKGISTWSDIDKLTGKEKRIVIQKIATEFAAFKGYENKDVEIAFDFSNSNFKESYGKQKRHFQSFAKLFSVFDEVIENAVGIEVHNRNAAGYKPDPSLKNVYVLMSAFEDGDNIIPVKLEVKEFSDKQNTLYVAVTMEEIKKAEVSTERTSIEEVAYSARSANISISRIFEKINTSDQNFLKYVPNGFLNDQQILAKKQALEKDGVKYSPSSNSDWNGSEMGSHSISTMLEARFGSGANDYLTTFIKDLNGAKAQSGGFIGGVSNLFTKFKKTAVGASLSVVVQQPTAIIRATSEIDAKYFAHLPKIESLNKKWEQIQKYAPIAIIKDIGGFDAGSGRTIAEWLNADTKRGVKKALDGVDNFSMWGASFADKIGWGAIWTAVGREVQAKQHLKYGTEEFWQACGKRFTEVIVKTQVYDSTLSRSGFMRGKDSVMKMATSFMGEPTLSVNMIADSILQVKRGKIKKRQVIRTVAAVYTATVVASLVKSFIYALRDDDEDESLAEKYMQALGGTILNDINPLSMLPVTRDVVSILEGWDVGRSDMAIIEDLYKAIRGLESEEKNWWRKIEDLAGAMGALAGVPAKNFLRTAREIYNLVNDMFDGIEGGDLGGAFVEGVTGKDKSKSQTLYEALIDGDPERIYAIKNDYKTADDYAAAVRKALRDYDPRIKKAGKALYDGDLVTRNDLLYEIVDEGVFDEETVLKAIDAEADKIAAEVKAAEKAESDVPWYDRENDEETPVKGSIYSASDIGTAFDYCSDELALEIIAELTELKVGEKLTIAKAKAESNGEAFDEDAARVEAEDSVRSTLRSTVTKHYKPLYRAAYASSDRKEMQRIADILEISGLYVYKTSRDLDDVLNEWIEEE